MHDTLVPFLSYRFIIDDDPTDRHNTRSTKDEYSFICSFHSFACIWFRFSASGFWLVIESHPVSGFSRVILHLFPPPTKWLCLMKTKHLLWRWWWWFYNITEYFLIVGKAQKNFLWSSSLLATIRGLMEKMSRRWKMEFFTTPV